MLFVISLLFNFKPSNKKIWRIQRSAQAMQDGVCLFYYLADKSYTEGRGILLAGGEVDDRYFVPGRLRAS